MDVATDPQADWVDLSEPPDALRPVPAERVPQPLWYCSPREEWPWRLSRTIPRTIRRLRPLAASVAVHAAGVYLAVMTVGAALNSPPPVGGAEGERPAAGSVVLDATERVG